MYIVHLFCALSICIPIFSLLERNAVHSAPTRQSKAGGWTSKGKLCMYCPFLCAANTVELRVIWAVFLCVCVWICMGLYVCAHACGSACRCAGVCWYLHARMCILYSICTCCKHVCNAHIGKFIQISTLVQFILPTFIFHTNIEAYAGCWEEGARLFWGDT